MASAAELHASFLAALDEGVVVGHGVLTSKPLEVRLRPPLPTRVRLYAYSLGHPPGGRKGNEHKINVRVPGPVDAQGHYHFDHSGGYIPLVAGYRADIDVWVFWDAYMHPRLGHVRNMQVRADTVFAALEGQIASQDRCLRKPTRTEVVLATPSDMLADCIQRRFELTVMRLG